MTVQFNHNLLKTICDGLKSDGYVIIDHAFPAEFIDGLQNHLKNLSVGDFKTAGIGRAVDFQKDQAIRSDQILWLDETEPKNQSYFNWIESLKIELNQRFFLGLTMYECMFAHYPKGAFYHKHVDAFKPPTFPTKKSINLKSINNKPMTNRVISTLLYLNPNWQAEDGGELLMYTHENDQPFKSVLPELGRLVVFLSEEFPHEVLPANKSRYSLTGWFRS